MKRHQKSPLLIGAVFAALLFSLWCARSYIRPSRGLSYPVLGQEELSPSGTFVLRTIEAKYSNPPGSAVSSSRGVSFEILSRDGHTVVFRCPDVYPLRHRFEVFWGKSNDNVWFYSGDIGYPEYWERSGMSCKRVDIIRERIPMPDRFCKDARFLLGEGVVCADE